MSGSKKLRIGIVFGGPSREREISFAGGRTVFDNLDKALFDPVLVFVDTFRNFILLDWHYIYKGSIRDFFPADQGGGEDNLYIESLVKSAKSPEYLYQVNAIGRLIAPSELPDLIDFAFLCLHGHSGEDGQIQGLMSYLDIPYSGSGVFASALGMNKDLQKRFYPRQDNLPPLMSFNLGEWKGQKAKLLEEVEHKIGYPCVVRPANQGSSIGVQVVQSSIELEVAVEGAFFIRTIQKEEWLSRSVEEKRQYCRDIIDIRSDLGYPLYCGEVLCYLPEELQKSMDRELEINNRVRLRAVQTEHTVMVEAFIRGREFSCIVLRDHKGEVRSLPPTEIIKGQEVYDYRSKYLPGLSRKETPMKLAQKELNEIRKQAKALFLYFDFQVYARIDGFYTDEGEIILNDPNTTSGMLPSSFFFHQAAEVGWTPSGFISYIIGQSLEERQAKSLQISLKTKVLSQRFMELLSSSMAHEKEKIKVAVILGGYSSERHISVESGRNIFEKLSGTEKYSPQPVFLTGKEGKLHFYSIPINLLLKDNADDILKGLEEQAEPWVEELRAEMLDEVNRYQGDHLVSHAEQISLKDMAERFDFAFIALHGRPGEDGELQKLLEEEGLPYNGSGWESAAITIDKYKTLQLLAKNGFKTAAQQMVIKGDFIANEERILAEIEASFGFPLIAKPNDDGCSSAVKKIDSLEELHDFFRAAFRKEKELSNELKKALGLKYREEFPQKGEVLIEQLIDGGVASRFLEITGGLITSRNRRGEVEYEIFHPSEAISSVAILSLEEKFLAGEGTNITPPRYDQDTENQKIIDQYVRQELERAARILKVEGYARIDAFVRIYSPDKVELIIIEINSLPGMTPATAIFHQAALAGMRPYDFIDKIIEYGLARAV